MDADPLPPPSLSRLPLLLRPCFSAHSLPYRFFSSPREIGKEVRGSTIRFSRCPGKWQLVAKVGGDRMPLVPVISEVGRGRVAQVPQAGCAHMVSTRSHGRNLGLSTSTCLRQNFRLGRSLVAASAHGPFIRIRQLAPVCTST